MFQSIRTVDGRVPPHCPLRSLLFLQGRIKCLRTILPLTPMPDDPILGLVSLYQADERPNKVNLGVGVYLNEAGKVPLL